MQDSSFFAYWLMGQCPRPILITIPVPYAADPRGPHLLASSRFLHGASLALRQTDSAYKLQSLCSVGAIVQGFVQTGKEGRIKSMRCHIWLIETKVTLHGSGDKVHLADIKQYLYLNIGDWNSTINS